MSPAGGFLDGHAVVVTGAGRGLGAAYARLAAAEGASVVANDITAELAAEVVDQIRASGGQAVADDSDISTWAGAGRLIARCIEQYGKIDGLVNNAAIFRLASVAEQDPADFRATIEVNLLGSAYCGLHALWAMTERGSGSVVNVTSGAHAGSASMAAYGAAGVNGQVVRIDGDELSMMTHPGVVVPSQFSPQWTPESVAGAFERGLAAQAQPLGVNRPAERDHR